MIQIYCFTAVSYDKSLFFDSIPGFSYTECNWISCLKRFTIDSRLVTACFSIAYNGQHLSLPEIGEYANQPSGYNFPK